MKPAEREEAPELEIIAGEDLNSAAIGLAAIVSASRASANKIGDMVQVLE